MPLEREAARTMRILLADDHDLVRETFELLLKRWEPTVEVLHAGTLGEALARVPQGVKLDLILLDVKMPGMNRLVGLERIRQYHPGVPVVLLTGWTEPAFVESAMAAGAAGFIPKTMSSKGMIAALQLVLSGQRYIPDPQLLEGMAFDHPLASGTAANGHVNGPSGALSDRERHVLSLLTTGVSNKEIARRLEVEVVTVAGHLSNIYRKLGVANRTQAVRKAMELGWTAKETKD